MHTLRKKHDIKDFNFLKYMHSTISFNLFLFNLTIENEQNVYESFNSEI